MNILTFDIEEWFHILDHKETRTEADWRKYPSRIHQNMELLFDTLSTFNTSATFFCLGWVAEKYPEIVREIADKGYEVASHSHLHPLVYELSPKKFEEDLKRSIQSIEDSIGKKVTAFRAPGFSITSAVPWAFEILAKYGIKKDASIFPAKRAHGGFPLIKKSSPFTLNYNGIKLKEFPINYTSILNKRIIYSGGGYFRLFPYSFIKSRFKDAEYNMTYFHPRDFDTSQPKIENLGALRTFKCYVGLNGALGKLHELLKDFNFVDLSQADQQIDWDKAPEVVIQSEKV